MMEVGASLGRIVVGHAFLAPQPITAPNRGSLALNSNALDRYDGPGYSSNLANDLLIRGFDRWNDYGYG